MREIDIEVLKQNASKAQKMEDSLVKISKHDAYIRELISKCILYGVCPDCGGGLKATGHVYYYGLFKRKKYYSHDVDISCSDCDYYNGDYPVEGITFKVEYLDNAK